jgi:hypothetical protein
LDQLFCSGFNPQIKMKQTEIEQSEKRIADKLNLSEKKVLVCYDENMELAVYIAEKLSIEEVNIMENLGHKFSYMNKNITQTVFFHKEN